jgi:hypothetical protein
MPNVIQVHNLSGQKVQDVRTLDQVCSERFLFNSLKLSSHNKDIHYMQPSLLFTHACTM